MTEVERISLGNERKFIFVNFCNGVPIEPQGDDQPCLMQTFRRSRLEIEKEIAFVAKRIQFSRHKGMTTLGPVLTRIRTEMAKPKKDSELIASLKTKAADLQSCAGSPIECDLLTDIRRNRLALLSAVEKLGPLYLSSDVMIPRVNIQQVDQAQHITEINQRARAA